MLYGLWVLALFYGFLLLFLPLVRALKGQLPVELSLRGPRYEEADKTAIGLEAVRSDVQSQKALVTQLTEALEDAGRRIVALEAARKADGATGGGEGTTQ